MILYKADPHTGIEDRHIKFTLLAGTYSIDDFNAKVKLSFLQERQDWEAPQIKDLKLVILKHYTFMASNTIFNALGIFDSYLEKTTLNKSTLSPDSYKTCLDTLPASPPPQKKSLSIYCEQINIVKNEIDGQPSSLLTCTQVSDYKAAFTLMHLVFLELNTHHCLCSWMKITTLLSQRHSISSY